MQNKVQDAPHKNGNGRRNGDGNGHSNGDATSPPTNGESTESAAVAALRAVVAGVTGVGYTLITLSMDALHAMLDPLIAGATAIEPMTIVPASAEGGRKGTITRKEFPIFRAIVAAARAVPEAFVTRVAGGAKVPFDVDRVSSDLDRYELLRQYIVINKALTLNALRASLVLGRSLRDELKPRYKVVKALSQHDAVLNEHVKRIVGFYASASAHRQEPLRRAATAVAKTAKAAAKSERATRQATRAKDKEQATAQRQALRSKGK